MLSSTTAPSSVNHDVSQSGPQPPYSRSQLAAQPDDRGAHPRDDAEILRLKARRWAMVLIAVATTAILLKGHATPGWVLACGTSTMALHAFPLPRWARLSGLMLSSISIVPVMYYGHTEGGALCASMYATVVFTTVLYAPTVVAVAIAIAVSITLGSSTSAWAGHAPLLGRFGLLFPSVLMFAFCLSWRRSALSEHARAQLSRRLTHQNHMLRQALDVLDELGAAHERARIARELHDRVGHCLTSIHVYLEAAGRHLRGGNDAARHAISRALGATSSALAEVRECVEELRASASAVPLSERIRRMIDRYAHRHKVDLVVQGDQRPLPRLTQEVIARCLQESLTNAARHSEADQIRVRLSYSEDRVELSVRDDGRGCEMVREGFGLTGMRERVSDTGGRLTIDTSPGAGFEVRVAFGLEGAP